jgi:hypothetical protein
MNEAVAQERTSLVIENNGDVVVLKNGNIDDFHIISPDGDPEEMRMAGALSEMLFEQTKNAFGASTMLVVAETPECKLVMFPRNGGFAVWKTTLSVEEILKAVRASNRGAKGAELPRRSLRP